MCANAAQMSLTAAGSVSGASENTTQCAVPRARMSMMADGNVFVEQRRRAHPPHRRRSARPRGTSTGRWGMEKPVCRTMVADSCGVHAEPNDPQCTTRSTGRVGDGAEAIRGYPVVSGRTFATKTSVTAVSVPRSTKSVSSVRTSVQTGHVHGGLQRSASAPPRMSRRSTAWSSRSRTCF